MKKLEKTLIDQGNILYEKYYKEKITLVNYFKLTNNISKLKHNWENRTNKFWYDFPIYYDLKDLTTAMYYSLIAQTRSKFGKIGEKLIDKIIIKRLEIKTYQYEKK